jgi:hypothetical protein
VNGWQADGDVTVSNGDCRTDIRAGDAYSVRFRHPQLPGAVITRTAYAAWYTRNPDQFLVLVETEWAHPGRTEPSYDARFQEETWGTAAEADQEARRVAASLLGHAGSLDWDGQ